jgi:4-hydroxy-tetrahydrodipicolinate synthase
MKDGEVSYGDLENLISKQIDGNVSGLVPCGTTGESPTLCKDEHIEVIRQTIGMANGKVPVIAGTGANSTQEALFLTENADKVGADAFLIVAPYYNKPSQEGLFAHFTEIAKRTEKPIVLYSIPSRCGIEISTDTVKRLRDSHPHICALKEAGGRSSKVSETVVALDSDFTVLSGDDGLTLPFMACGAKGVVSVASNLIPQKVVSLVSLALEGKFIDAQKIHLENYNFFTDIFCEPNPVPIKTLLHLKKIISSAEVRLPLSPASSSNQQLLEKIASDL